MHPGFDETFYVLAGELTFQLGDERLAAPAGTLVFAPGETPHTFANLSGIEARVLPLCPRRLRAVFCATSGKSARRSTHPSGRWSRSPRSGGSAPRSAQARQLA